jgi:hypothetical protein
MPDGTVKWTKSLESPLNDPQFNTVEAKHDIDNRLRICGRFTLPV